MNIGTSSMLPSSISVLKERSKLSCRKLSISSTVITALMIITSINIYLEHLKNNRKKEKQKRTIWLRQEMKKIVSKLVRFLERIVASPLILHGHLKPAPPRKKLSDASPEIRVLVAGHRTHVLVMIRGREHVSVDRFSTGSHISGRRTKRVSFLAKDKRFFRLVAPCLAENRCRKILLMGEHKEKKIEKSNETLCCCIDVFLNWKRPKKERDPTS